VPAASNRYLFQTVYSAVLRLSEEQPLAIPTTTVFSRLPLYRAVDAIHCGGLLSDKPRLTHNVARDARSPRDLDADDHRWSGKGYLPAASQAGLYVSLSTNALSAEMAYYQHLSTDPLTSAPDVASTFSEIKVAPNTKRVLFVLTSLRDLLVIDFARNSAGAARFFRTLDSDPEVAKALRGTSGSTFTACRSGNDYSCSRAVALALASLKAPSYDGILVQTARDNRAIRDDGDNLVIFGANKTPHPKLTTSYAILPTLEKGGRMTLERIPPD
jgi:hypothetical protein